MPQALLLAAAFRSALFVRAAPGLLRRTDPPRIVSSDPVCLFHRALSDHLPTPTGTSGDPRSHSTPRRTRIGLPQSLQELRSESPRAGYAA